MKNLTKKITGLLLLSTAAFLATGCQKEETQTGQMTVRMTTKAHTDPTEYDAVNIDIEQVQAHYDGGKNWVNLATYHGIYNLLDLTDGTPASLVVEEEMPVGHITQIRIILGSHNTVEVDGTAYELELSSQDITGLKINVQTDVDADETLEIFFNFDADKSIVVTGSGDFRLKPILQLGSVQSL